MAVADLAERGLLPHLVVDPVLVSSTGHRLLEPDGVQAYLGRLLPHALVVTPNLREAAVLGDTDVDSLRTLEAPDRRGRAHQVDGCPLRRRQGRPPHRLGG